uniref:Glycosyl hydrolase family 38 C-terminal domain-containing protein n=1 Tax=Hucho hucho TaxID=62062 RepID=A0A4W5L2K8_9TELE
FDDVPLYWDAWDVMDYHLQTRKPVVEVVSPVQIASPGGLRGSVTFTLRISDKSTITQEIILDVMCPYIKFNTQVLHHVSLYQVQYSGTVDTMCPYIKFNTQVWGHKWADLSEHGFGVSLLNDSKYVGSSVDRAWCFPRQDSGLRAPKAPDANADMGSHQFTYAVMPHTGESCGQELWSVAVVSSSVVVV